MEEKLLTGKKNGMLALLLILALYILAGIGLVVGIIYSPLLAVLCILYLGLGWILLLGLKVLRPQEALVLTLFGKYVGTLKGEGYY